jgi:lysozyme family protein
MTAKAAEIVAKVLYALKYNDGNELILFAVAVKPNALDRTTGNCDDPRAPGGRQEIGLTQQTAATSQVQQAKRQYLFKRITRTRNDNRKVAK